MKMPSRMGKVDLSKINGPYPLMGLSLLVVEGPLGYWLFRSESGVERAGTGLVMVVIFGMFVYALRFTQAAPAQEVTVKPPQAEATEKDLVTMPAGTLSAPDGSYIIDAPPEGWRVREMNIVEWVSESIGIADAAAKQMMEASLSQARDMLVFDHNQQTSIIPVPGKTLVDGRKYPSALEVLAPTQLAILPIERAQPPLFVERPLEHNFLMFVGQVLSTGVLTLRQSEAGVIATTGRRFLVAEFRQEVTYATVNGREGQNATISTNIMGIEGELRDHMLLMKYSSVPGDALVEQDLKTLQSLVASFRPLKVVNAEQKRKAISDLANEKFQELIAKHGSDIFTNEFVMLLLRMQGVNLDDPEARLRAQKVLKPFRELAREIDLHEEDFDELWEALDEAEKGDATSFKTTLKELIDMATRGTKVDDDEPDELPQVAETPVEEPDSVSSQG